MKPSPIRPQLVEGDELKKVLLLVDYSNILYRAYFSSISGWEERPWLPLLRFIDSLRLFVQRSKVKGVKTEIIFAGESREKLERSKFDPSYKSNRVPVTHEVFRNFRKIMALVLDDMGAKVLSRTGVEADDIIAAVVGLVCSDLYKESPLDDSFKNQKTDVIIFSNDKDLYQLLRFHRCYIYQMPGLFYTRENFIDEFGFHPDKFDLYKAMVGDKSDDISGVNGIGPVKATEHILNNTVPVDDPEFINSLKLVSLEYDLDVPNVGTTLSFNTNLNYSRDDIWRAYGAESRAFAEIQLAVAMLSTVYYEKGEK